MRAGRYDIQLLIFGYILLWNNCNNILLKAFRYLLIITTIPDSGSLLYAKYQHLAIDCCTCPP